MTWPNSSEISRATIQPKLNFVLFQGIDQLFPRGIRCSVYHTPKTDILDSISTRWGSCQPRRCAFVLQANYSARLIPAASGAHCGLV